MMGIIRDKLLHSKNINKSAYFWNAFAAMMNSFQTMLLLLIITHFGDDKDSSIFVMAYAVGNLMLNVGKYGVRQYQVTDVTEKNSFSDYLHARFASNGIMLAGIAIYLLVHGIKGDYSGEKMAVVFMICMVKFVEAFEDVYHGRMQYKTGTLHRILRGIVHHNKIAYRDHRGQPCDNDHPFHSDELFGLR
jgi:hypothetical protein